MVEIAAITAKTMDEIKEALNRSEDERRDIVSRCRDFLEVTRLAVFGLREVFDEILNDAESCDLRSPHDIEQLRRNINDYTGVDRFRPELRSAIRGLRKRSAELAQKADRRVQWPKIKRKRQNIVEDLNGVIDELDTLHDKLENEGLRYLKTKSGIGIVDLEKIVALIEQYKFQPGALDVFSLKRLVEDIRQSRSEDELWQTTDLIMDISEDLDIAFKGLL
jgi:hypothetical protein